MGLKFKKGQTGGGTPEWLLFDLPLSSSGIANLSTNLTINGTTVEPTFVYHGGDANANNLSASGFGETLAAQGSGGSFNQGSPYLGTNDDSWNSDGTRTFKKVGDASYGNITTEDFVIELILKATDTNALRVISNYVSSTGYIVDYIAASDTFRLLIGDGAFEQIFTAAVITDAWYHILVFADRSGSAQFYVNGVASGAAVDISAAGTLATADIFTIGGSSSGSVQYNRNIAYLAMWKRASWLDTHLQADVAKERFQKLCGFQPDKSRGTAAWDTYTRASTAYTDKFVNATGSLYLMGDGHPRMCQRVDKSGSDFQGYCTEAVATNYISSSQDFDDGEWIAGSASFSGSAAASPTQLTDATILVEDATADTFHSCSISMTTTSGSDFIVSLWAKKSNRTWFELSAERTDDYVSVFYDLDTGDIGTTSAFVDASGSESFGDDWYRTWFKYRADKADSVVRISLAAADNDTDFDGLSQDGIYIFGSQVEVSTDFPSSYIYSTGSVTTRNADVLLYNPDNIGTANKGAAEFSMLFNNVNSTGTKRLMNLGNAAGDERITFYLQGSGDKVVFFGRTTEEANEWNIATDSDITDNDTHTIRGTWRVDEAIAYIDGISEGTPDTACKPPARSDFTKIEIGSLSSVQQPNALINNIKIWNKPKKI